MKKIIIFSFLISFTFIGCAKNPQASGVFVEPIQYICKKIKITHSSGLTSPIFDDYDDGSPSLSLNANNISLSNPFDKMNTVNGTIEEWKNDPNPKPFQVKYTGIANDIHSNNSYEIFLIKEKKYGTSKEKEILKYRVSVSITAKNRSSFNLRCKGK